MCKYPIPKPSLKTFWWHHFFAVNAFITFLDGTSYSPPRVQYWWLTLLQVFISSIQIHWIRASFGSKLGLGPQEIKSSSWKKFHQKILEFCSYTSINDWRVSKLQEKASEKTLKNFNFFSFGGLFRLGSGSRFLIYYKHNPDKGLHTVFFFPPQSAPHTIQIYEENWYLECRMGEGWELRQREGSQWAWAQSPHCWRRSRGPSSPPPDHPTQVLSLSLVCSLKLPMC